MTVNEAVDLAERLESLVRRSHTYFYDADDLRYEIRKIASEYRNLADELDLEMSAFADEQYLDKMVVAA
jgi:hypothetical protein